MAQRIIFKTHKHTLVQTAHKRLLCMFLLHCQVWAHGNKGRTASTKQAGAYLALTASSRAACNTSIIRLAGYNYMSNLPIIMSSRYPTTASNSASEGEELQENKDGTA